MKPKLIILLALLTVFSFTTKAQSLTLEQTVEYISNLIKGNTTIHFQREKSSGFINLKEVAVDKSGLITFSGIPFAGGNEILKTSFNVFDLEKGIWEIEKSYSTDEPVLKLFGKNNISIGYFGFIPTTEANRLYKALLHLKEVCTRSADPFGN